MIKVHKISQRQAFKAVGLAQSTARYKPRPKQDGPVISELQELVEKHPSIGFWQSYYRIRRKGLYRPLLNWTVF
jgi:putative transposase